MTIKILANDGIDEVGKQLLTAAGFEVITEKVSQENLISEINKNSYSVLTVRSATKVRKDVIDGCPDLKIIARGGVGMDNIDVDYAREKGMQVINTPAASSNSVAELVFAHLFNAVRFLYDSNRQMPNGEGRFEELKKKYSKGIELRGKKMGVVGFGRIGQNVAKMALGLGMEVLAFDPHVEEAHIEVEVPGADKAPIVAIKLVGFDKVIQNADFITFHVPGGKLISKHEIASMKNGVILINTSRGGVIDEDDLLEALNSGKLSHACLDVFENEPNPSVALLNHPKISLTPHIGAATNEAQERIGVELAEKLIAAMRT
jgi:D-3-phosphoglycerate dehydrogenase / 2-oxoglutarate reductase